MIDAFVDERDPARPVVAIYREMLLNYNEPFVRNQAESMSRYIPYYVGVYRVGAGLELPIDRTIVLRDYYGWIDRPLHRAAKQFLPSMAEPWLGRSFRLSEFMFKVFGASPRLANELRRISPSIVHAHTGVSGAHALPLAKRLNLPLVVTYHGYESTATDETLLRRAQTGRVFFRRRERMKREVALFVSASEFIHNRMLAQGYPAERTRLLYMGVDTHVFRPDSGVVREPVVLFVGRLAEVKGVATLIAAMRAVQADVPSAELVVVGEGKLRTQLEQQARELDVRVRFLGGVDPETVRLWMLRASALAVPSIPAQSGSVEGLSIVALEAQAMGLPVVGSVSGGIPEAVIDRMTGVLVPPGDIKELALALKLLLTDANLRERMGRAGRERVLTTFDLKRQTGRLEDLYDEVRATHTPAFASTKRKYY
jgi:colanic acid/amylovoran biosynthesis glycosyltransferase